MFSHIKKNNQPGMVDVSEKDITHRTAKASALIQLPNEIKNLVEDGEIESKKGPVLTTAIIAGTQAVWRRTKCVDPPDVRTILQVQLCFPRICPTRNLHVHCHN